MPSINMIAKRPLEYFLLNFNNGVKVYYKNKVTIMNYSQTIRWNFCSGTYVKYYNIKLQILEKST